LFFRDGKVGSERAQKLEKVMADLPSKISAIDRLQWGIEAEGRRQYDEKAIWGVLFTFEDAAARDACLATPEYKAFEEQVEAYLSIEYIATDDWSF
jgi:hypothetical protein